MLASRRRALALGVAALVAGGVLVTAPTVARSAPTSSPAISLTRHHQQQPTVPWRSGVFAGFSAKRDRQFGGWRGSAITSITDYQTPSSWSAFVSAARYALAHLACCAGVARCQVDRAVVSSGSLALLLSGLITRSSALFTGMRTPPHEASGAGPSVCPRAA